MTTADQMTRHAKQALAAGTVILVVLVLSTVVTPVLGQGAVSVNAPETVGQEEFEIEVTMSETAVGEVVVESDEFDTALVAVDDDGDSLGNRTATSVEFIDPSATDSTYRIVVNISDAAPGDTGEVVAATGDGVGGEHVNEERVAPFEVIDEDEDEDEDRFELGVVATLTGTAVVLIALWGTHTVVRRST